MEMQSQTVSRQTSSKKKKAVKGEKEKAILMKIVASLNDTMQPSTRLACVWGDDCCEKTIVHVVHKKIFSSLNVECAVSSEPIDTQPYIRVTDTTIEVRSLPLGEVAFVKTPDSRSTSHPVSVVPKEWLGRLKKISLEDVSATRVTVDTVSINYSDDTFKCGSTHLPSGEHRWREYKLCSTLDMIKSETIKDYLFSSLLPCLHAMQPGYSAQLWLGIADENNSIIGIGCSDKRILKKNIAIAVDRFSAVAFPPIPPNCVKVDIHEVLGSTPDEWGDNAKCYMASLSCDEAKLALRYFVGRCAVVASADEPGRCTVYTEEKVYNIVMHILGRASSFAVFPDDDPITLAAKTYIDCARNCKTYSFPEFLFNWSKCDVSDVDVNIPSRVVVCIEIELPHKLCHCVCVDPTLCDDISSGADLSYTRTSVTDEKELSVDDIVSLSPLQIWLRAKGLKDGALIRNLYFPLVSDDVMRVLVLQEEGEIHMTNLEYSLFEYTNHQHVKFGFRVHAPDDLQVLSELVYRRHCDIVLVTTWKSRPLADSVVQYLRQQGCIHFQTLMFSYIHDDLRLSDLINLRNMNLQDIAVLGCSPEQTTETLNALKDKLEDFLVPVPISSDTTLLTHSEMLELLKRWAHGDEPVSWLLLDAGKIPFLAQTNEILTMLRSRMRCSDNAVDYFRVFKKYPGSGATTMLYSVGWALSRSRDAVVYFVKKQMQPESISQWLAMRKCEWVVLLVDDDIYDFDLEAINKTYIGCKLSILHVTSSKLNTDKTLNPILSHTDLEELCKKLDCIICADDARMALNDLVTYAKEHDGESENRHIYVVMRTATSGKFTPPRRFIESALLKMNQFDRDVVLFLAFLSQYALPFAAISVESYSFDQLSKDALELTRYRRQSRCIAFLHSCLADVYIAVAHNHSTYNSKLQMLWITFEVIMGEIKLTQNQFASMYRCIFVETSCEPCTKFQAECCEEKWDANSVNEVFLSDRMRKHCEGFAFISCSKVHRRLRHYDEAVSYARSAFDHFKANTKFSNLAKNHLAETLGVVASVMLNDTNSVNTFI